MNTHYGKQTFYYSTAITRQWAFTKKALNIDKSFRPSTYTGSWACGAEQGSLSEFDHLPSWSQTSRLSANWGLAYPTKFFTQCLTNSSQRNCHLYAKLNKWVFSKQFKWNITANIFITLTIGNCQLRWVPPHQRVQPFFFGLLNLPTIDRSPMTWIAFCYTISCLNWTF